jgi:putative acyl-CoA dehydrogenase
MLLAYAEAGVGCPLSMTYAAVPALRHDAEVTAEWTPRLANRRYHPELSAQKDAALMGMSLTERQGGSDVRANETRAEPAGDGYLLTGQKWFCSAPMCDAFLVLAQAPGGLTCFVLPRVLADGTRNGFHIERLKDKLGNRSNASAEIELREAWAARLGEEGRGIATIIEMVVHTRLDCVLGSAALMRRSVAEATHHASHRIAFGKRLVEQPLQLNVLADLCLDSEAATATALRLARAVDEGDQAFQRLATTVAKYHVCKSTPPLVAEALECIGGNGYVEESALPRLFRESPLNSLWEGAGNVNALDLWRAAAREPESVDALLAEIRRSSGWPRPSPSTTSASRRRREAASRRARRRRGARVPRTFRHRARCALPAGLAARAACPAGGGGRVLRHATRGGRRARLRHAPARCGLRRDRRAPPPEARRLRSGGVPVEILYCPT